MILSVVFRILESTCTNFVTRTINAGVRNRTQHLFLINSFGTEVSRQPFGFRHICRHNLLLELPTLCPLPPESTPFLQRHSVCNNILMEVCRYLPLFCKI
jgi:hypothetical protein